MEEKINKYVVLFLDFNNEEDVNLFFDICHNIFSDIINCNVLILYTKECQVDISTIKTLLKEKCGKECNNINFEILPFHSKFAQKSLYKNMISSFIQLPSNKDSKIRSFIQSLECNISYLQTDFKNKLIFDINAAQLKSILLNDYLPNIQNVQIQTHSRCNANCVFCPYVESWHYDNPGLMSDDLFYLILDELKPFANGINKGKFCPYLMQEPLIDKQIFKYIKSIYDFFPNTLVEISTNGIPLTQKVIDKMMNIFPERHHEIWISHHGINQKTLEHIMDINHDKSVKNIINLLKQADGQLNIKLRGAGLSKKQDIQYFTSKEYQDFWYKIFKEENINISNIDLDSFVFHDRAGTINRKERNANKNNYGVIRDINEENSFYCNRIDNWAHILYDGSYSICCMDYHKEIKLPKIQDIGLVDFVKSEHYLNLVNQVLGLKESPKNFICKRCSSPGG